MATFAEVKARAERDQAFLALLIVNPKKALTSAKIKLTDPADVHRVELLARVSQEHLKVAGKLGGISIGKTAWGIGAGCCNSRILNPAGDPARRIAPR